MKLNIKAICDKGRIRQNNEDMILIGNTIVRDSKIHIEKEISDINKIFFTAVADGMGGHNAGEIASELVLKEFSKRIELLESNLSEKELREKFQNWAKEIHHIVLEEGNKDINKKGMGTTLIGLLFYNVNIFYINVGDSRLYRFRNGYLMQISKDHSLQEITGNKTIPSNIIVNSFGGGDDIFIDFERSGKILNQDLFLLCSDGLSDMLTEDEIENILKQEKDPVDKLFLEALNKGGKDNISIVLIEVYL